MAFFGLRCPQCRSQELGKKRRCGIRYKEMLTETGLRIGEYRYYGIRCYDCKHEFYCQERHYYAKDEGEKQIQKLVITEEEFLKAHPQKPGTERIGSTAGEYTLMIAAGADHPYAMKYLELLSKTKGGEPNEQKRQSLNLVTGKISGRD